MKWARPARDAPQGAPEPRCGNTRHTDVHRCFRRSGCRCLHRRRLRFSCRGTNAERKLPALTAATLAPEVSIVEGRHGSMTIPKPRNTVDGDTAPWNGTVSRPSVVLISCGGAPVSSDSNYAGAVRQVPWPQPFDTPNWCSTPSAEMHGKDPRNLTGTHGQACFW